MPLRQEDSAADMLTVPLHLAPLAALLVELGAREIEQRGGSRAVMQDLPELEAILRAAAASSAYGRPADRMPREARRAELTTSQAAMVIGISAHRVRELARNGRLVARKVAGRDWLIDAGSARSYRRNA
jgi:excisionase family DNA binding protein